MSGRTVLLEPRGLQSRCDGEMRSERALPRFSSLDEYLVTFLVVLTVSVISTLCSCGVPMPLQQHKQGISFALLPFLNASKWLGEERVQV